MNARELIANIERTIERTTDEYGNNNPEIVLWVKGDYDSEKSQKHTVILTPSFRCVKVLFGLKRSNLEIGRETIAQYLPNILVKVG